MLPVQPTVGDSTNGSQASMSELLSKSTVCVDHVCPACGAREHVTVERIVVGERVMTWCHCRVCGHSWHPEEAAV